MSGRPAVFLDRDGTLIEDRHYPRDPDQVVLLPGAAAAVRQLDRAGLPVVVVTNQSGIARGLLTEDDYLATTHRLDALLAADGARLAGHYHCPHLPEIIGPLRVSEARPVALPSGRRGPRPRPRPQLVGRRPVRDLAAARDFGGRGILVLTGAGAPRRKRRRPVAVARAAATRRSDADEELRQDITTETRNDRKKCGLAVTWQFLRGRAVLPVRGEVCVANGSRATGCQHFPVSGLGYFPRP